MKSQFLLGALGAACTLGAWAAPSTSLATQEMATSIAVVPAPASVEAGEGRLTLGPCVAVSSDSKNLRQTVEGYLEMRDFPTCGAKAKGATRLNVALNPQLGQEAYTLEVSTEGINLAASTTTGLFYGVQTLAQMFRQAEQSGNGLLPACTITDEPRFGYRGMMLEVVRCYLEPSEIRRIIDAASELKLNNLHLHLTDDNGWRLEIKKYPKLTEVGAWRVDRPELFPARLNARSASEPATYGGFYTQQQMRDLVRYAAERHVNIVPEIEMPAHSVAAIASYPELACPVVDKFVGVFPGIGGKDASIIICGGNDFAYKFYKDVLSEVMDIFPSKYIHLGGDEANKSVWEKCPKCNEAMHRHGFTDFEQLQGFFMDSINSFVRSKGRTAIGWDEASYGNPQEEMVMMGWQGDGSVAVRDSRKSGRKFILTPAKVYYLIRYQGPQWFEPYTYFGNSTLKDAYDYEPVGEDWTPELADNLLGVQGSLWGEFCRTPQEVYHQVFPRLLAVADVAWRPQGASDWQNFLQATDGLLPHLQEEGINSARSMFNIQHTVKPVKPGEVEVTLECIRPDVEIRYAFNDSTFVSPISYKEPFGVSSPTTIYASTFNASGERVGEVLPLKLDFNRATGASVTAQNCTNSLPHTLTNGLRGRRNSDFEWAGFHNGTAEFVVDLGSVQPINGVTLGNFANADICCAAPYEVLLYGSEKGTNYTLLATARPEETDLFHRDTKIVNLDFGPLNSSARFLKVVALNPGAVPDGLAREGAPTWLYFDEISVK